MLALLADIGGTNTRMALARDGTLCPTTITRYRNADFRDVYAVIGHFLETTQTPNVDATCIAVAGPVLGDEAKLTNGSWTFSSDRLRKTSGATQTILMNDLAALAFALPFIRPVWVSGGRGKALAGQALVVGMGTGFNVSLARMREGAAPVVFSAELGHASLPLSVIDVLDTGCPDARSLFPTVEHCFSGPGLERLHQAITGQARTGGDIIQDFSALEVPDTHQSVPLFAKALGVFTQELMYQYLPLGGLYFAGSASVGVLGSPARDMVAAAFDRAAAQRNPTQTPPLFLIEDDTAALWGCLSNLTPDHHPPAENLKV